MNFYTKLDKIVTKNNSLVCVGLDPDPAKLPKHITKSTDSMFTFNKAIIDAVSDLVCVFKPNSAMYEAGGEQGIKELKMTCQYIQDKYPEIPILLDCKRGDIGNTNSYYAKFVFDYLGVDAITISPYMGGEANESFLSRTDRGLFVLCKTSNPGASEFQDLKLNGEKLYQIVAKHVASSWNANNNCSLVVGATYPIELSEIRKLVGNDFVILVPGAGAQGGSIKDTVNAGVNKARRGIIINSSREIIFASSGEDFAEAARDKAISLRNQINEYR